MDWSRVASPPLVSRRQWSEVAHCIVMLDSLEAWLRPASAIEVSKALLELKLFFKDKCHLHPTQLLQLHHDLPTAIDHTRPVLKIYDPVSISARRCLSYLSLIRRNLGDYSSPESPVLLFKDSPAWTSPSGFESLKVLSNLDQEYHTTFRGSTLQSTQPPSSISDTSSTLSSSLTVPSWLPIPIPLAVVHIVGYLWSTLVGLGNWGWSKVCLLLAKSLLPLLHSVSPYVVYVLQTIGLTLDWSTRTLAWTILASQFSVILGLVALALGVAFFFIGLRLLGSILVWGLRSLVYDPLDSLQFVFGVWVALHLVLLTPLFIGTSIICVYVIVRKW